MNATNGIARFSVVALDCQNPRELAEFYAALTEWAIAADERARARARGPRGRDPAGVQLPRVPRPGGSPVLPRPGQGGRRAAVPQAGARRRRPEHRAVGRRSARSHTRCSPSTTLPPLPRRAVA